MGALAFIEFLGMIEGGVAYFASAWNYVDLTLYAFWYGFFILKYQTGMKHDVITDMKH